MDIKDLYNQHAAAAAADVSATTGSTRDRKIAEWLAVRLAAARSSSPDIIELAIGDGNLSFTLARRLPQARITGVDIAQSRIESARRRAASADGGGERMSFQTLDIERELGTLPDASADVVIGIDVLEHVFDVFGVVSQVARIVRPGGIVIIRVPNVAYLRHRLDIIRGRLPITASWFGPPNKLDAWRATWGWDGGHLHYFTQATLRALLADAGLKVVEWRDPAARFEAPRRVMPGLLIGNLCVLATRTMCLGDY